MRRLLISLITTVLAAVNGFSQDNSSEMKLLFMGDIMGHIEQIEAAKIPGTKKFSYAGVFDPVAHIIQSADYAIANLEVTLAGAPYGGYPCFSSPDALAVACHQAGIDVLLTANNHALDRGRKGLNRTLDVLDKFEFAQTGTFGNVADRMKRNLLVLEKDDLRVGILNYTEHTNGIPQSGPAIVNMADTLLMFSDIEKAKLEHLDKLIVVMHWGPEYQHRPGHGQEKLAKFLFRRGVDIVIGAHPHVLQRMEYHPPGPHGEPERFIAFSLGNFVSNQRTAPRDGGAMVSLTLTKTNGETRITDHGYHLTWVRTKRSAAGFEVLPCAEAEHNNFVGLNAADKAAMRRYMNDMRLLLDKVNVRVPEIKPTPLPEPWVDLGVAPLPPKGGLTR
jgi:poly-gamma-glutamate capsule biosynthesis protein CapA/YwtB (metallophosphatase superfamily)